MDARVKAYSAFISPSEQQGIRQPETFAKPQQQPEKLRNAVNPAKEGILPNIHTCMKKNNPLREFNQDSRLRGNDEELTISCVVLGFAKVSA